MKRLSKRTPGLKKELAKAKMQRDILKKGHGVLCKPRPVKYAWIESQADLFEVSDMCEMLKVTRSNYYHWLNTDTSEKDLQTEVDTKLVKNAFKLLKMQCRLQKH
jgi:hypothetical protein